ncbi:MAG: hypothetical protein CL912_27755 [Deltaproteobacteria bacterium]|nr:hypothetical protein [Deltaproteobacteria bacterium]
MDGTGSRRRSIDLIVHRAATIDRIPTGRIPQASVLPLLLPFRPDRTVLIGHLECNRQAQHILALLVYIQVTELLEEDSLYHLQETLSSHLMGITSGHLLLV